MGRSMRGGPVMCLVSVLACILSAHAATVSPLPAHARASQRAHVHIPTDLNRTRPLDTTTAAQMKGASGVGAPAGHLAAPPSCCDAALNVTRQCHNLPAHTNPTTLTVLTCVPGASATDPCNVTVKVQCASDYGSSNGSQGNDLNATYTVDTQAGICTPVGAGDGATCVTSPLPGIVWVVFVIVAASLGLVCSIYTRVSGKCTKVEAIDMYGPLSAPTSTAPSANATPHRDAAAPVYE
eukprot:m.185155 g.185155  ORF g.185155 m.185155 type:complete len:238 (-) comp16351_c0_seq1:91-804(-)